MNEISPPSTPYPFENNPPSRSYKPIFIIFILSVILISILIFRSMTY